MERRMVASSEQVSSDLGGEVVILNVRKGVYCGLCGVGAHVWRLLQEPRRLADVRDALLQEYEVSPQRCEEELVALVRDLAREGLVECADGTAR
ncbi:MAG: PqqD family peptide modification chaperone [Candidatus Latescibacterota bacterium]